MGRKRINEFSYNLPRKAKKSRKNNSCTNNTASSTECLNYENSYPNYVTTNSSRYSLNIVSIITNMQTETSCKTILSNSFYLDLGDCTYTCQYCGAFFWLYESSNGSKKTKIYFMLQKWKN